MARMYFGVTTFLSILEKCKRPPERQTGNGFFDSIIDNPGPMKGHHSQRQSQLEFVIFVAVQPLTYHGILDSTSNKKILTASRTVSTDSILISRRTK